MNRSFSALPPIPPPTKAVYLRARLLILLLGMLIVVVGIQQWRDRAHAKPADDMHGDSETASAALSVTLAKTPEAQRLPLLLHNITDASPGLRYAAVDALGDLKTPVAADAIEAAFGDSSSVVRQRALEVLPGADAARGLHLQLAALRDEDRWIREAAISQLTRLPRENVAAARQCVPALIQALGDRSEAVQSSAAHMLWKVTGHSWRIKNSMSPARKAAVVAQWRQWWQQNSAQWPVPAAVTAITSLRPKRTDPAPNFDLRDINGRALTLASQRGRITLLNFWGTWCPPCQLEIPDLAQVDRRYRDRAVDVIGVALSEPKGAEGVRQWCQAHSVDYRQALATDAILDAYGHIEEVPVSVLLDAQGRIRYRWEGERDFATFQAAIERLLSETPAASHP